MRALILRIALGDDADASSFFWHASAPRRVAPLYRKDRIFY